MCSFLPKVHPDIDTTDIERTLTTRNSAIYIDLQQAYYNKQLNTRRQLFIVAYVIDVAKIISGLSS